MKINGRFWLAFGLIFAAAATLVVFAFFVISNLPPGDVLSPWPIAAAGGALLVIILIVAYALHQSVVLPAQTAAARVLEMSGSSGNPQEDEFAQIMTNLAQIASDTANLKNALAAAEKTAKDHGADLDNLDLALISLAAGDTRNASSYRSGACVRSLGDLSGVLNNLQADLTNLATSIAAANFQNTIPERDYQGEWKKAVVALNDATKPLPRQFEQMVDVLNRVAKGYLDTKLTDDFKGDLGKLKFAINSTAAQLNKNINDIHGALGAATARTRLQGEFPQDFAKIKTAIVDLADKIHVPPMPVAQPVVPPRSIVRNNLPTTRPKPDVAVAAQNRVSGAYKPKTPISPVSGPIPDFMRNDFGKY